MPAKRVLSVGQCAADNWLIARMIRKNFDADLVPSATFTEALGQLRQGQFDLVLINRVFDADGASGLDLIKQIKADETFQDVPVMLVSNHADPQREAASMGALPGFGKGALGQAQTIERLKRYLS